MWDVVTSWGLVVGSVEQQVCGEMGQLVWTVGRVFTHCVFNGLGMLL